MIFKMNFFGVSMHYHSKQCEFIGCKSTFLIQYKNVPRKLDHAWISYSAAISNSKLSSNSINHNQTGAQIVTNLWGKLFSSHKQFTATTIAENIRYIWTKQQFHIHNEFPWVSIPYHSNNYAHVSLHAAKEFPDSMHKWTTQIR